MSPEYFFEKMSLSEADAFLVGVEENEHSKWEQIRYLMFATFQSQSSKRISLNDIFKFPWEEQKEEQKEDVEITEAEKEEMARARQNAWKKAEELSKFL